MKRISILFLSALLVSTGIISWTSAAGAANGKIVIGRIEAISGPFKASGERFVMGGKFAVDEINAKGGLLGKEVVLLVEDSAFKPDVTTRKVTKLILEDKVDIISGIIGSHVAIATMKVAEKYRKVFVLDNSEAASITGAEFNPYIFRTTLNTGQRSSATISYFAKYTKFKKFYILCQDFSLGRELGEGFKKNLKKMSGAQLLGEDYHPIAVKDFAPYISKIISSGAEVVLTGNYGPDLTNLLKTGASLGWKAITGGSYLFDPVVMQDVKEAALGHLVLSHNLIDLANPVQKQFVKEFQEKHKDLDKVIYSPVFGVNDTYYAFQWLFEVIRSAGSTDADKIIKVWEGMSFGMPWGRVTMRACDHQIITPVKAALIERDNQFFPFPYTGKPIVIPEEEVTVPPADTGNVRCK